MHARQLGAACCAAGLPESAAADEARRAWETAQRDAAMHIAAASVDYFIAPSKYLRDRFTSEWARPCTASRSAQYGRCVHAALRYAGVVVAASSAAWGE